jgi:hypothetical protein
MIATEAQSPQQAIRDELAAKATRLRRQVEEAPIDVEAEMLKAMQVLERIEAVCGDAVARGELPRLLDDLGVRIGLTFRAGITNRRAARVLQGGIMAFGNRLLPCTLRTSGGGGRPRRPPPTA